MVTVEKRISVVISKRVNDSVCVFESERKIATDTKRMKVKNNWMARILHIYTSEKAAQCACKYGYYSSYLVPVYHAMTRSRHYL